MEEEKDVKPKGFDLIVTHRDEKTGRVIRTNPYIMRVVAADGGGRSRYWERPAGSGNLFDRWGKPVGRWDNTKPVDQRFVKGAAHVAWEAPLTEDQKVSRENAALKAELASLKAEQTKKAQPTKKDQGA